MIWRSPTITQTQIYVTIKAMSDLSDDCKQPTTMIKSTTTSVDITTTKVTTTYVPTTIGPGSVAGSSGASNVHNKLEEDYIQMYLG